MRDLRETINTRLNFELSLAPEIVEIGLSSGADAFCLVPESREEVTTEGGLDVLGDVRRLRETVPALAERGGDVSLFIDPDEEQIRAAADVGARFVELHTGRYALCQGSEREAELRRLASATELAQGLGLQVNAGHGLDYDNVLPVASLPGIVELNIGYAIVAEALFSGVDEAVGRMVAILRQVDAPATP